MPYDLVTILGPTAVGKTNLAAHLAHQFNGEIISADSRQVYKFMDIGTGKDLSEYNIDGTDIPVHLIDVLEPAEEFNLFLFHGHFHDILTGIKARRKIPFLVGGTGLYIHSVLNGYSMPPADLKGKRSEELSKLDIARLRAILFDLNENLHNSTDLLVKERVVSAIIIAEEKLARGSDRSIKIDSFTIGIFAEREEIKKKITERLKLRLKTGMIEEVEGLIQKGLSFERLESFGLEYKYLARYLKGELNYNDMYQKLNGAIHSFAKRQMTWFRKIEREGEYIHWIKAGDIEGAANLLRQNFIPEFRF